MESMNNPNHDETESVEIAIEESQSIETSKKKAKTATADCWKFFTKIGLGKDGVERAKCNGCHKEYKVGGRLYGTSSLNRHISKCKEIKFEDVGQMMIDMQGKLKSIKIDQMVSREMCAAAIIEHDLPFKFVEYKKIRSWAKYLNSDVVHVTRNTAKADVLNIYMKEKGKLKQEMARIPSRISLTSDLWTACTTEGYICLTAHFVDFNWKLNSKILNFCHMPPPHTGFELSKKILEFLKDWGIEKNIFSLTLDNASANDNMQENLKSQLILENWLLCDGEFFHVRCSAHILNLIVQEGLKVASGALHKIRESIKHVKGSENRMKKFKECLERTNGVDASIGLRLDVSTRWNSTYLMLEGALKYQRVFSNLHLNDESYKYCPSAEEWRRGAQICQFLMPFYHTTNLISGTSYPTSNLYFLQVWKIQCVLIESLRDQDEVIKSMAERMIVKFEKYWDEYSVVLALGAVLDPRMKFSTLTYCYSKVDASTCEGKIEQVKRKLNLLFENYSSKSTSSSTMQSNSQTTSKSNSKEHMSLSQGQGLFDELRIHNQQLATQIGKSQLDIYLEEPNLDVLQWWKDNKKRLPDLSLMARDLLRILITTIASEFAFSIGSRILNKYRSRLLSKNMEALICTRNWLHGFVNDDEDEDEDQNENVEPCCSKAASNVLDVEDLFD